MELKEILLVLHIAGAGTWLGANIVQAVAPSMTAKQSPQAAAGWYRVAARLPTRVYIPAAVLILATGIWMVLDSEAYSFGNLFVNIGFGMIIIGALLGSLVFGPGSERAAQAVESGDKGAIRTASGRIAAFGTLDTLLLLFTITAMVLRLGA
ncbi:MAG: hypothetical protein ACRDWS_01205 [Acidimicrobiia bacterium]